MRSSSSSWSLWSTTLFVSSPITAFSPPLRARQADNTTFDWTSIQPTRDLQYHTCYGGFQCARLELPLDYTKAGEPGSPWTTNNNSFSGPQVAVAIVTLPASVPATDPSYGGPILINPGGPGGQGTLFALQDAVAVQTVVDVPEVRHYDIVGFDPRGVGLTTPSAACYGSEFARAANVLQREGMASLLTDVGLQTQYASNVGVSELCAQRVGGEDSIFRFMSTASVARDMLEITQKIAELHGKGMENPSKRRTRVQYFGVSYGSYLGNTFASMFPGWVGRLVIDGIVDPTDYTAGDWAKNIYDAEEALDVFYDTCFNASTACPLLQSSDTSAADIRARVTVLIKTLQQFPAPAIYNDRPYAVTSVMLSETIRVSLYTPITLYAPLADALANALAGNWTAVLSTALSVLALDDRTEVCTEPASTTASPPQDYTFFNEALIGIACGDSQASAGLRDLSRVRTTVGRITNESVSIGEGWARFTLGCAGWRFSPPYAFRGPFGSPAPVTSTGSSSNNNDPAAPLLILSTRKDPATPLPNAYLVSRQHAGSAVVVLEATGHCAMLSATSQCMYGHVREYFHTGTVPANGTVCQPDCVPSIPYKECPGLLA